MSPISTRKQTASTITGIDADKITTFNLQLTRLRQLGILIVVEVKGVSMFTSAASFAEYGIADEDVRRETLDAGRRYLFPKELVKRIRVLETRFRQVADKWTFPVEGVKPYRWLPYTAYDEFREEWDRLIRQWDTLRADIVRDYDTYVDAHATAAAGAAERAWTSIKAQDYSAIEIGGRVFTRKSQFVDAVVERAVSKMPSQKRIKAELVADYRVSMLDEGDEAQSVDFSTLEGEGAVVAKLAAMRQAELEHAREALSNMANPLDDVFSELRRRVREDVLAMLDSIKTNGFLKGKVAERGAGLLDLFDLMAVHGDAELRSKLADLKSAIGPIGADRKKSDNPETIERDVDAITKTLKAIVKLADDEVEDVTLDGRFAFLDPEDTALRGRFAGIDLSSAKAGAVLSADDDD